MKEFTVETGDGAGHPAGLFGELVISEPDEFRNRSFTSHLVLLPWSEKLLTQRVEESFYAGKHMVFCRKHDDQLAIVSNDNNHHHSVTFSLKLVIIRQNLFHSSLSCPRPSFHTHNYLLSTSVLDLFCTSLHAWFPTLPFLFQYHFFNITFVFSNTPTIVPTKWLNGGSSSVRNC